MQYTKNHDSIEDQVRREIRNAIDCQVSGLCESNHFEEAKSLAKGSHSLARRIHNYIIYRYKISERVTPKKRTRK